MFETEVMALRSKRILSFTLSLSLLLGMVGTVGTVPAQAAGKKLTIEQVRNMAVANSAEISKKENELILKQTKYLEAVDTITAKVRNKQTLRWSPLLSFQFPQPLNMVDEYDVNTKPLVLQSEITVAEHNLRDLQYDMLGKVSDQYVKLYNTSEKQKFTRTRLQISKQELERSKAKVLRGQATQSDVDKMKKSMEKLNEELGTLGRELEAGKKELSDLIKMNVTSGYEFTNPLQVLNLPRNELKAVTEYTLDNDQGYYEAKLAKSVALMTLESYESLLNKKFNTEMGLIRPYIAAVKQGSDVDFAAFKITYKQMLKDMDEPWNTTWNFWFFSFPYEWFKGEVDGTRYIEDEMYAPYTACMDYNTARKTEESTRKALTKQVERDYNTLVNAYNSYLSFVKTQDKANDRLQRTAELGRQGRAEDSEVQEALETYESAQLDVMDALVSYNELLNSFDRLTCGAAGRYISGAGVNLDGGAVGMLDTTREPYYYIYTRVEDMTFTVGIKLPAGFTPRANKYELWLGGQQIGTRTDINEDISHLALDYADDAIMTVKLFRDNTYVAQGTIDARIAHGRLELEGKQAPPPARKVIGEYTTETQQDGEVKTSTVTIKPDSAMKVAKYNITRNDGTPVYTGELLPIDMPFTYLTLLIPSLENVTLMLYDKDSKLIDKAAFNPAEMTITVPIFEKPKEPVVIGKYTVESRGKISGINYCGFYVELDSSMKAVGYYRLVNPADIEHSMEFSRNIANSVSLVESGMTDDFLKGAQLELYDEKRNLMTVASLNLADKTVT
ncbi:MAG: hypothetical protein RR049_02950, partial [Angelakisella sp.]